MSTVTILTGANPGSTTVGGQSKPGCPCTSGPCDGKIHVFNCGPDRICHNGDDVEIGIPASKNPDGTFTIMLTSPLQPGEAIYAIDDCFDPPLVGPLVIVSPAVAPAMSARILLVLIAVLSLVGFLGIQRLRAMR